MITTKLIGGLGNQMFQYAIGRNLAKKNNTKVYMDLSGYKNQNPGDTPRDYALGIFNVQENFADEKDVKKYQINKYQKKFKKIFGADNGHVLEIGLQFKPEILESKDNSYLEGYWQSEKYFVDSADIIRQDFSLKNPLPENVEVLEKNISATNSVSIHIRRGDYITNKNAQAHHGSCDLDYYKKAIGIIKDKVNGVTRQGESRSERVSPGVEGGLITSEPHFFVFSDDIDWCKENFKLDNITFVSDDKIKDYEEMYLMSKCKHNIVANSSFSWWGAWLNTNLDKIVIAPQKWLNNPKENTQDICPDSWTKI